MKCRRAPSRYYGRWGQEGLCRPCVERMPPEIRRKVLRDLHPPDRKRYQLDELAEREASATPGPRRCQQDPAGDPPRGDGRAGGAPAPSGAAPAPRRAERRRHARLRATYPVSFVVLAAMAARRPQGGRAFRSATRDLSRGGVRILILDPVLLDLPAGTRVHLEIGLPRGAAPLRGTGTLRNVVRVSGRNELGYLCLAFDPLPSRAERTLNRLLEQRPVHPL